MIGLPSAFSRYGDLEAEHGLIKISLARSGMKTIVAHLQTRAPLLVQRALYPERSHSGLAHIYLMSSAGGILQGDRLEIDIRAGKDTASRITTQAATKIYRMNKGFGLQVIGISAAENSYVEFLPHQLIPFRSSRFCQSVDMRVWPNSTVVYSETISAGRMASGERFDFDLCFLKMTAKDAKGKVLFSDACSMEPAGRKFELAFGGRTIWSTVYIVTPHEHNEMDREIAAAIESRSMLAGCSILPNDSGLLVRILDDSIDNIVDLTSMVVKIARRHTLQEN